MGVAQTTNQSRDYWTEIRKINNAKKQHIKCNKIDCHAPIALQIHLLHNMNNCTIVYPVIKKTMHTIYDNILLDVNKCYVNMNDDTDHCNSINVDDVYSAIRSLNVNEADSVDDLYSDNFKTCHRFYLFNILP